MHVLKPGNANGRQQNGRLGHTHIHNSDAVVAVSVERYVEQSTGDLDILRRCAVVGGRNEDRAEQRGIRRVADVKHVHARSGPVYTRPIGNIGHIAVGPDVGIITDVVVPLSDKCAARFVGDECPADDGVDVQVVWQTLLLIEGIGSCGRQTGATVHTGEQEATICQSNPMVEHVLIVAGDETGRQCVYDTWWATVEAERRSSGVGGRQRLVEANGPTIDRTAGHVCDIDSSALHVPGTHRLIACVVATSQRFVIGWCNGVADGTSVLLIERHGARMRY